MTVKSGLRWLFEELRQSFLTRLSTTVALLGDDGSSVCTTSSTGRQNGTGYPVLIDFPTGGTVGQLGITYRASLDDGRTWTTEDPISLGVAESITLAFGGGTLEISLSGTIADGGTIRWVPQPIAFCFGELEPARQDNQGPARGSRIAFVPGGVSRKVGKIDPPREPGGDVRSLADHLEAFATYVWAYDVLDPENPVAQHDATLLLFHELYAAAWGLLGAIGDGHSLSLADDALWQPVATRALGREIVANWTVRTPIREAQYGLAYPVTPVFDEGLISYAPEE